MSRETEAVQAATPWNDGSLRRVFPVLAALAPLVVVTAGRLIGAGPQTAVASGALVATAAELRAVERPDLSEEQLAVLDEASANSGRSALDPFFRLAEVEAIEISIEPESEPVASTEDGVPRFDLELSSVVGGARPIAIIGGEVRRLGLPVIDGWLLVAVDAEARTATVRHRGGTELVLEIADLGRD